MNTIESTGCSVNQFQLVFVSSKLGLVEHIHYAIKRGIIGELNWSFQWAT